MTAWTRARPHAHPLTLIALGVALAWPAFAQPPETSSISASEWFSNTGEASDAPPATGDGRTLQDFFSAAMEHSPSLRIAEERANIGSAQRRAAVGRLLPQVSANASISDNRQRAAGNLNTYRGERYSMQLRQTLFDWSAFQARREAELTENQFEVEYYAELGTLLTTVAERFFAVLEAEDRLASNAAELRAVENQLEQVQRMHNLRMVPITELYDAQARHAIINAEQLNLRSELVLAREALRATSGLSVGPLYQLTAEAPLPTLEGDLDEWLEQAQRNNRMISARELAVEAAERRVSQRRGAYMPQVSISAQQQQSTLGFDNMPMNRTDTTFLSIDVNVPLYAGGSNRAQVREAMSQQNIARNELRQLQLDVGEQTRMLYLRMQANEMRISAGERVVDSTRIAAESRQRSFELGDTTSVEVLDAIRDQFSAIRELQGLRYEQIRLWLALRREAGTLSADDLLEISAWLRPVN